MKRNTWQREAVKSALDEIDGFVGAQTLHGLLRERGSIIALATVYRTLNDLCASDAADSLKSPDGEVLFRACTPSVHHHHLICRDCGLTVEISAAPVETWANQVASENGFSDAVHIVDVFGRCSSCKASNG